MSRRLSGRMAGGLRRLIPGYSPLSTFNFQRSTLRVLVQRLLVPPNRREESELMDEPGLDQTELAANFRDIRRVNRLLGGCAVVLRSLPRLIAAGPSDRPVMMLDLATGSGDIPMAIVRWAKRRRLNVSIVASDVTPEMLDLAKEQVAGYPEIRLERYDARAVPLADQAVDIVLCSLALHHFGPDEAVRVLTEMHRLARIGFIVNDLRRNRFGYGAAWLAARLTTRNRLTRNDAPLSVLRAYTPDELAVLLQRAGITDAAITLHPWFRMAAVAVKDHPHD